MRLRVSCFFFFFSLAVNAVYQFEYFDIESQDKRTLKQAFLQMANWQTRVDYLKIERFEKKYHLNALQIFRNSEQKNYTVRLLGKKRLENIVYTGADISEITKSLDFSVYKGQELDFHLKQNIEEEILKSNLQKGFSLNVKCQPKYLNQGLWNLECHLTERQQLTLNSVQLFGVSYFVPKNIFNNYLNKEITQSRIRALRRSVLNYLEKTYSKKKWHYVGYDVENRRGSLGGDLFLKFGSTDQKYYDLIGNKFFSRYELVKELKDLGWASMSEQQVVTQVEAQYRKYGFAFVKVEVLQHDEKLDVIRIEEGPRVKIKSVLFSNTIHKKKIRKIFFDSATENIQSGFYDKNALTVSEKKFLEVLYRKGFGNLKIINKEVRFNPLKTEVEVSYRLSSHKRKKISQIKYHINNQPRSMNQECAYPSDKEFDYIYIEKTLECFKDEYVKKGYHDVIIKTESLEALNKRPDLNLNLDFFVETGTQYLFGRTYIKGLRKTKERVVDRTIRLKRNEPIDPDRIQLTIEEIQKTTLFETIKYNTKKRSSSSHIKDLYLDLKEGRAGRGEVGVGAVYEDPLFRLKAFGGLSYQNLYGENHQYQLRGEVRFPVQGRSFFPFIEYFFTSQYKAPYLFHVPGIVSFELSTDNFQVSTSPTQLQSRTRGRIQYERDLSSHAKLLYRVYQLEHAVTTEKSSTFLTLAKEEEVIGSIGPSVVLDYRDSKLNPRLGSYHVFDIELSHPWLLSSDKIAYVMFLMRNSVFHRVNSYIYSHHYFGAGYARSFSSQNKIPETRLVNELSLGGRESLRGFGIKQISPNVNSDQVAYLNLRNEVGVDVSSDFSLATFWDYGQLYFSGSFDQERHALGIGLRYHTPVGPIALDFARGFGAGRRKFQFYVSLGTI